VNEQWLGSIMLECQT